MPLRQARAVLGVGPFASPGELRRAFRDAAKQAHPDRSGCTGERFRQVVEAYRRLQPLPDPQDRFFQPPAERSDAPQVLAIDPLTAMRGGAVEHPLLDGRRLRIRLPAGLRAGDAVRAGGLVLTVTITGDTAMLVRGDDLWITVSAPPRTLAEGGRLALETPLGRRIVWVTRKAGERGLVRIVGQGLPARGGHAQGHLFVRLAARRSEAHDAARTLLRRFTAAWAA
jgi:curved DNA-binding protein